MELSADIIKEITRLIAEKLGAQASPDEVAGLVREAIARLSNPTAVAPAKVLNPVKINDKTSRKLILNAFGTAKEGFQERIKVFIAGKALRIANITTTNIDKFSSVIILIDYSDYHADLSQLKFELDNVCSEEGFRAIIQDSSYYNTR